MNTYPHICIDISTLRRAGEIYWERKGRKMFWGSDAWKDVLNAQTWADLDELVNEGILSLAQYDSIVKALQEQ